MKINLTKLTIKLGIILASSTYLHSQSNSVSASLNNATSAQTQDEGNITKAIFPNDGWKVYPILPAVRWAQASAFVKKCSGTMSNGAIFVFGGFDAAQLSATTSYKYDLGTNSWTSIPNLPTNRGQLGAAVVKNKIYIPGGYTSGFTPTSTVDAFDPETNTYTTMANMIVAVGDYAIGTYKDSLIYILGGYNGSIDLNTVQVYNPSTNSWSLATSYPGSPVAGLRGGITGNKIIIAGGYNQNIAINQSTAYQGVIDPNNPNSITWTQISNYPAGSVGRGAAGASPFDDGLVYFTGGDPSGTGINAYNGTYAYNTNTNTWDSGPNKLTAVNNIGNFVAFEQNDSLKFACIGGYTGSSFTNKFDVLKIGKKPELTLHSSDTSFCGSGTVTISASGVPNYYWSPSWEFANNTLPTQTITTDHTILATVTYKPVWGCTQSDSVLISAFPIPTVLIDSLESLCFLSSPFQLTGAPSGGTFTGNGVLNSMFMPSVAGVGNHLVTYSYTTPQGCSNSASTSIDIFNCLDNENSDLNKVIIYPNPFENFITVEGIANAKFNLVNAVGQTLISGNSISNSLTLDVSSLASGIYFISIENGNTLNTHKIIKK